MTSENKEVEKTLIYAGIGLDEDFLDNEYLQDYKRIICYDALPLIPHYEKDQAGYKNTKSKKCYFRALRRIYGTYEYKSDNKGHYLEFSKKGILIKYYYSTTSFNIDDIQGDIFIRGYVNEDWDYYERSVFLADDTDDTFLIENDIDYNILDFD